MVIRIAIGVLVGGGLGFGYYQLAGCSGGACPLTSSPVISIIYGMVVGGLVAGSLN